MKYAGSKPSFLYLKKNNNNNHPSYKRVCNLPSRQIHVFILRLLGCLQNGRHPTE